MLIYLMLIHRFNVKKCLHEILTFGLNRFVIIFFFIVWAYFTAYQMNFTLKWYIIYKMLLNKNRYFMNCFIRKKIQLHETFFLILSIFSIKYAPPPSFKRTYMLYYFKDWDLLKQNLGCLTKGPLVYVQKYELHSL